MYIWLIGIPGVGKSRAITLVSRFLRQGEEIHIAPTSCTSAALIDFMVDHKNHVKILNTMENVEYNSAVILADELTAFTSEYDNDMIGILTKFYDVDTPYGQKRRGKDLNISLQRPQLNMLVGSTPSNLMKYIPTYAWDQGFTSRVMLIHSNDRMPVNDIFEQKIEDLPADMIHDFQAIRSLYGEFKVDQSFSQPFHHWRNVEECKPMPSHPRLLHYCTRRWSHLLKLAMISSVDRGHSLIITDVDFGRAKHWLVEAEDSMGFIFSLATATNDSRAQDELIYFVRMNDKGNGVREDKVTREARRLMPINTVKPTIDLFEKSGVFKTIAIDRNNMRTFRLAED